MSQANNNPEEKPSILGVYAEDYPWDVRVEKLLRGFNDHGYDVHLVCRNLNRSAQHEKSGVITCHRVIGPQWSSLIHKTVTLPAPFNPIWYNAINRAIKSIKPSLLMVRDLPLAALTIDLGRKHNLPVIVDMAENHPAMWQNVIDSDSIPFRSWLLKNPILARHLEKRVARSADTIFVVVEEMRDHLLAIGGIADRIAIVSNTPPSSILGVQPDESSGKQEDIELIYVGHITKSRGLHLVLKAIALLGPGDPKVRFHIVGRGNYLPQLEALVTTLGISENVVFHGWVDSTKVPDLIAKCNVGIIPHLKTEHTDTTIPNKIFDYMGVNLPVIVSDADPLKRIVAEEDCGIFFECDNIPSLSDCLRTLADVDLRSRLAQNGHRAVTRRYNWEHDILTAMDTADSLVAGVSDLNPQNKLSRVQG